MAGPIAVAAAWIPLRDRLADVNAALVLVAVVSAVGAAGRRGPVVAGAVVAALAFDVFDTAPYGTLAISRSADLVTTVLLALVAAAGGLLVVLVQKARLARRDGTDAFSRVRDAAALVAEGGEPGLVLATVLEEIRRLLGLRDCWYEADPPPAVREVTRDGLVVSVPARTRSAGRAGVATVAPWDHVELPVWVQGQRLGGFRLVVTPGVPLDPQHLMVAVTLADQAGAALAGYGSSPRQTDDPQIKDRQIEAPQIEGPGPEGEPQPAAPLAGHLRLLR
jgi:K+-sensing histidine kinase KdpD